MRRAIIRNDLHWRKQRRRKMHGKVSYLWSRRKEVERQLRMADVRKRIELNRLEYDKLRKEEDLLTRWNVRTVGVIHTDPKRQR